MVLRESIVLVIPIARVVSEELDDLLFGVEPTDAVSLSLARLCNGVSRRVRQLSPVLARVRIEAMAALRSE